MTLKIEPGLIAPLRSAAADLYWQAFGEKLGRVMGPASRGISFVTRVMDPTHVIAATENGHLLGIAGFKTAQSAFVGGDLNDLFAIYGLGAMWRAAALSMLERPVSGDHLLMDGIVVAANARGRGIGTRLLHAITDEARRRDLQGVRLDVIDTNPRAKALYEREGFRATDTEHLGALSWLFRFKSATTMIKQFDP